MTEDKIQSVVFTAQNNELKCDDYYIYLIVPWNYVLFMYFLKVH